MTTEELGSNIDRILQYFKKDRQIEIKQFLPLVVKGFPLDEILTESENRGLLKKINSVTSEIIYELTEKGEIVVQMGGFVSYLSNDLEMTRLTRKNLKITFWSTIGQFALAFFVAIATCISAYIAWSDYKDKKDEKLRQNETDLIPLRQDTVSTVKKESTSKNIQVDSLDSQKR